MSGSVNPGSGVAGVGGNQVLPFKQRQTRAIVGDDVVWGGGGHSLKFGAEYERQTTFVNLPLFGDGVVDVPEPDGVPAEPAVALSRRAAGSDRCGAQHRRMADHQLRRRTNGGSAIG